MADLEKSSTPTDSSAHEAKPFRIGRFTIGLNVIAQILIVFALVAMVNYYSLRHFNRWDFSRNRKFALASQTRNLLKNLEAPVQAIVFFPTPTPEAQQVAYDVQELLREYSFASGQKMTLEMVDPSRNLQRAKELADKYKFGAQDNIVILDYKGKSKFVNAGDMVEIDQQAAQRGDPDYIRGFKGEEALTSALLELTEEKQNKLYLVTGHGELAAGGEPLATFEQFLKRQNIKVEALSLNNVDAVPADASGVLIFGPKQDYSEREVQLLRNYWNDKKGRVMVLLNPQARTPRLSEWLTSQGVTPHADRVLKTGAAMAVENGQPVMRTNAILPPVGTFIEESREVTQDIVMAQIQLLGGANSLALDQGRAQTEKIRMIKLLQANEGYWGEVDFIPGETRSVFFDPKKDYMGPLIMAVALEKGGVADARVKVETARMIVVGNEAFLTQQGLQISEVGLSFGLNGLNWMLNRERVVGIPPKPRQAVQFSMDERQLQNLSVILLLFIPGTVALLGTFVWWQRRA